MTNIIKKVAEVKTPRRSTELSAGNDVFSTETITIPAGEITTINLPIGLEFDTETFKVKLYLRSSIGINKHLRLLEDNEIVPFIELPSDNDVKQITITLMNAGNEDFILEKDMHFAQFIITEVMDTYRKFEVENVADLRGETPVSLAIIETVKGVQWVLQETLMIEKDASLLVPTGYKVKIDRDTYLEGIVPEGETRFYFANGHTIIDADYYLADGHCFIKLVNNTSENLVLDIGTPLIELISIPYFKVENEIIPTITRKGGIGSTTE